MAILFGVSPLMAPPAFGALIVMVRGSFAILFGISPAVLAFRLRRFGKAMGKTSEQE